MANFLLWLTLVLVATDWMAVIFRWGKARWITKPGAMTALIAWFTLTGYWSGPLAVIGMALIFSLIGDIIMLLPLRYFSAGMAAFFLTHLFYIAGFNQPPLVWRWETIFPVITVAGGFTYLNKRVRNGLARRGDLGFLLPFVLYGVVLCLMWLSALSTFLRPGWLPVSAMLVSLGGSLFFLSDSLLVYHRFVSRVRYGDILIIISYHLAQIFIVVGMLEQFLI